MIPRTVVSNKYLEEMSTGVIKLTFRTFLENCKHHLKIANSKTRCKCNCFWKRCENNREGMHCSFKYDSIQNIVVGEKRIEIILNISKNFINYNWIYNIEVYKLYNKSRETQSLTFKNRMWISNSSLLFKYKQLRRDFNE